MKGKKQACQHANSLKTWAGLHSYLKEGQNFLKHLHKRDGEVEPLPQAPEGDKGLSWETARGHLTVGLLVLAGWTLADEAAHQQVHTLPSVLTYAWDAAARAGIDLTVLTWVRADAVSYRQTGSAELLMSARRKKNTHRLLRDDYTTPSGAVFSFLGCRIRRHILTKRQP